MHADRSTGDPIVVEDDFEDQPDVDSDTDLPPRSIKQVLRFRKRYMGICTLYLRLYPRIANVR